MVTISKLRVIKIQKRDQNENEEQTLVVRRYAKRQVERVRNENDTHD